MGDWGVSLLAGATFTAVSAAAASFFILLLCLTRTHSGNFRQPLVCSVRFALFPPVFYSSFQFFIPEIFDFVPSSQSFFSSHSSHPPLALSQRAFPSSWAQYSPTRPSSFALHHPGALRRLLSHWGLQAAAVGADGFPWLSIFLRLQASFLRLCLCKRCRVLTFCHHRLCNGATFKFRTQRAISV